ncbi:hypothetical protein BH09SUM1_BH09SUM1_01840 [soil metagenome]
MRLNANARFYIALIPLFVFWICLWLIQFNRGHAMRIALWMMSNNFDTGPPDEYLHEYLVMGYSPIALLVMTWAAQPMIGPIRALKEELRTVPDAESVLYRQALGLRWLRVALMPCMMATAMIASPMLFAGFGDPWGVVFFWVIFLLPPSIALAILMTENVVNRASDYYPCLAATIFMQLSFLPLFNTWIFLLPSILLEVYLIIRVLASIFRMVRLSQIELPTFPDV